MFDSALARQIYAASDIFLVPSRYEPCGLTQMIAMRYGSVPLVRATGGLADTVRERRKPNGFLFTDFSAQALHKTLQRALNLYYKKPKQWLKLQENGMKEDFSWKKSAKEYVKIYEKVLQKA
jgi:starch synthase